MAGNPITQRRVTMTDILLASEKQNKERAEGIAQRSALSEPLPTSSNVTRNDQSKLSVAESNDELETKPSNQFEKNINSERLNRGGQTPSGGLSPSVPLIGKTLLPVSPNRDFNKRANSIERDALPAGLFPGTSKKLYDALYLHTRGANPPRRIVTVTKRVLAEWSGVKNRKTLDAHLRYLSGIQLIVRTWELGGNEGYTYEINIPEEIGNIRELLKGQGDTGGHRGTDLKLEGGTDPFMDRGSDHKRDSGGQSQVQVESITYDNSKTVNTIKTKIDDEDNPFQALNQILGNAIRELTGHEPTKVELEKWRDVGELLIAELKRASARTNGVSSPGAFLAAHLRRQFSHELINSPVEMNQKRPRRKGADIQPPQLEEPEQIQNQRLSKELIDEEATLFVELLKDGYTLERLEQQFGGGVQPDEWAAIMVAMEAKQTK